MQNVRPNTLKKTCSMFSLWNMTDENPVSVTASIRNSHRFHVRYSRYVISWLRLYRTMKNLDTPPSSSAAIVMTAAMT